MSLVVGVWGPTKVGRTTFMTSAPGLAVAEFDVGGLERGSSTEQRETIKVTQFAKPYRIITPGKHPHTDLEGYTEQWAAFVDWYWGKQGIIYNSEVQTIGFDTATELYETRTNHELQQIQTKPSGSGRMMLDSTEYGPSNDDMKAICQLGRRKGKNLIWVFQEREVYKDAVINNKKESIKTDQMEHRGWSRMQYDMDIVLKFGLGPSSKPQATIEETGKGSTALRGRVIPEPTWAKLQALIDASAKLKSMSMELPDSNEELIELAGAL